MSFALSHKVATYCLVAVSFFAVALSGTMPIWLMIICGCGILTSWFWESSTVHFESWSNRWTVLSICFFVYCLVQAFSSGEFLLPGISFLTALLVIKCFQRQSPRDLAQLYALTFLMMVAGTVLQVSLTYGLLFFVYTLMATWALSLFHLKKVIEETHGSFNNQRQSPRVTSYLQSKNLFPKRFFLGTGLLSLVVFVSSVVIFLVIPRVGTGFFFQGARGQNHMSGFSDGVTLGEHGRIRKNDKIVMRVKVNPDHIDTQTIDHHWRGVAFDTYLNGSWSRSNQAPVSNVSVETNLDTVFYMPYRGNLEPTRMERRKAIEGTLKQEIFLEPNGYDVLFASSKPIAIEMDTTFKNHFRAGKNNELRHKNPQGIKYTAYSDLNEKTNPNAALTHSEKKLFLKIPADVTDRMKAKALEITKDAPNDHEKAMALTTWLQTQLTYTLEMADPMDSEPLDFFVFENKKGHCEYFASSLAVMARVVGIPSRNVNGFLGGQWNNFDNYIAITAGDAHSWTELFIEGRGWVTYDPTPAAGRAQTATQKKGLWKNMKMWSDSLRFAWFRWVIAYDLYKQLRMIKNIQDRFKRGTKKSTKRQSNSRANPSSLPKKKMLWGFLFFSLAAAFIYLLKVLKNNNLQNAKQTEATRIYQKTLNAFRKKGIPKSPHQTPLEHLQEVTQSTIVPKLEYRRFINLYYKARYSDNDHSNRDLALASKKLIRHILKSPKS